MGATRVALGGLALFGAVCLVACGSGGGSTHRAQNRPPARTATGVTGISKPNTIAAVSTSQPNSTLACTGSNGGIAAEVAPSDCNILYPNRSLNNGAELQHLIWTDWGKAQASAVGVTHSFHEAGPADTIRVVASGLRQDDCGGASGYWYTRLVVYVNGSSSAYGTAYCPQAPPQPQTSTSSPPSGNAPTSTATQPTCASGQYNAQGTCTSDPTFRATCSNLYAEWQSGAPDAQQAIAQYGQLGCDQPVTPQSCPSGTFPVPNLGCLTQEQANANCSTGYYNAAQGGCVSPPASKP